MRRAAFGSHCLRCRGRGRELGQARQCASSSTRPTYGRLLQLALDRSLRPAIYLCVIRRRSSFEPLESLFLRLFAEERDYIVFEKNPCATNPSTDDITLLREFHRRGAIDLEEVGTFL